MNNIQKLAASKYYNPYEHILLEAATVKKASALGIPDRSKYGDPRDIPVGELLKYVKQLHEADRAGRHFDFRFGDKDLFSWASRYDLPVPGQKRMWYQQPLHTSEYADFEGVIPKGQYGAGRVSKADEGEVVVTKAQPDKISFYIASKKHPEYYSLIKMEGKSRPWLMINHTPTDPTKVLKSDKAYSKLKIKSVPQEAVEEFFNDYLMESKIDGASAIFKLHRDGIDVLSYRISKIDGRPIIHTHRFFGPEGAKKKLPKEIEGDILYGEIFGERDGEMIPATELSGLLNSSIAKSLRDQESTKTKLRAALFGIYGGPKDHAKVRKKLEEKYLPLLPENKFTLPAAGETPEENKKLWESIKATDHPETTEGVIAYPKGGGKPVKIKIRPDFDVYIRDIFPGGGKYKDKAAGGFYYSLTPDGPIIGKVGTGMDDALRTHLMDDKDSYIGRTAVVQAHKQLPSGALFQPSLIKIHEDYPTKAKRHD